MIAADGDHCMESKGRTASRAVRPSIGTVKVDRQTEPQPGSPAPAANVPKDVTAPGASAEFAAPPQTAVVAPGQAPAEAPTRTPSADVAEFGREAFAALLQSQTAAARGLEALGEEWVGLALSGIDAAAQTATNMLAVKTLVEAMELSAGFTRRSLDTLIGGSTKLSELGAKLAAEASHPILAQLGRSWSKAARSAF